MEAILQYHGMPSNSVKIITLRTFKNILFYFDNIFKRNRLIIWAQIPRKLACIILQYTKNSSNNSSKFLDDLIMKNNEYKRIEFCNKNCSKPVNRQELNYRTLFLFYNRI